MTYEQKGVEIALGGNARMLVCTGNCQSRGAREYQEDSFGYSNITDSAVVMERGFAAVLSDGMGGLSDGKAVSDFAIKSSISMFDAIDPKKPIQPQLLEIVGAISAAVCEKYTDSSGRSSAGTTIVYAYFYKNRVYWVSVGDSRLLLLRKNRIYRLTQDHDYQNELFLEYLNGTRTIQSILTEPQKDSLVSFIGKSGKFMADSSVRGMRIEPGDIFVLCSDGIYNGIDEDAMKRILLENDAQHASEAIVASVEAARRPGQDNMTVMVIGCFACMGAAAR